MVSRPIWQRMLEWVQTSTPGDTESAGGKTEEASEEQASKDPAQAQSLIAREHARSGDLRLPEPDWTNNLRILFLAGAAFLIALAALVAGIVAGVVFVVHNAARLKLPWPCGWHKHPDTRSRQSSGCDGLAGGAGDTTPTGGTRYGAEPA